MFETRDGKTIMLHDTIYVIDRARRENKARRIYTSRDCTDVAIYAMEIMKKIEYSSIEYDKSISDYIDVDGWKVTGFAWYADRPKPDYWQREGDSRYYDDIAAVEFNTFATIENAQKALSEFKNRGLKIVEHKGMFADEN